MDEDNLDTKVGDIIEVVKTRNIKETNEYMVLSKEGLYFVKIKEVKKPGNGPS